MSRITGYRVFYTLGRDTTAKKEIVYSDANLPVCKKKAIYYFLSLQKLLSTSHAAEEFKAYCFAVYDSTEHNRYVPMIRVFMPGMNADKIYGPSELMGENNSVGALLSYGLDMEALHLPDYKEANTSELLAEIKNWLAAYQNNF